MSGIQFVKATKAQLKARVALDGPSGSGKTWTSLEWARVLAGTRRIAVIDTEHGSASLYADQFDFDTARWEPPYDPNKLAETIRDAAASGYGAIVLDSMSHFWEGEGGTIDIADAAGQRANGNSFAGWKVATPALRHLVDTMLGVDAHLIATMRTKTEWVIEQDSRGKNVPRRVGVAPVMRAGIEYEFTLVGDLDLEHRLTITKSRCSVLADAVVQPGRATDAAQQFLAWLNDGEEVVTAEQAAHLVDVLNGIPEGPQRGAAKQAFVARYGRPEHLLAARYDEAAGWVAEQVSAATATAPSPPAAADPPSPGSAEAGPLPEDPPPPVGAGPDMTTCGACDLPLGDLPVRPRATAPDGRRLHKTCPTGQGPTPPDGGGHPAPTPDQAAEERETERALEDGAAGVPGPAAGEEQASPTPAAASADDRKRRASRIHVLCGELWGARGQEAVDRRRHFLVGLVTDGRETSSARLSDDEQQRMINTLVMMKEGKGELHLRADGTFELRKHFGGRAA